MVDVHIEFHHLVELERTHATGDVHAQGVANELHSMMVLEKTRVLGKHRAFFGFLDVRLELGGAVLAGMVKQFIE